MSSLVRVPVPDHGVIVRRTGARGYVYQVLSTFRNQRGQPTNTRVSIGKIDEATGMLIPNDAYWRYYPCPDIVWLEGEDAIRSVGTVFLTSRVMADLGLTAIVETVFGTGLGGQVATLAHYMASRGNVMDHLESWCSDHTWAEEPLTGQQASRVFASITHRERMEFFGLWVAAQPPGSYLAYDVTSLSSYAQGITDTEWGHNRDGDRLPQINLGCYVNQDSAAPVFYLTYPGSITDVSHLESMMAYNTDLHIEAVGFVMDRGFCSTKNIQWMHTHHLDVIMGTDIGHKTIREAVDQVRTGICSIRHLTSQGVYARSVRGRFYGVTCTVHVYHDPIRAEHQRQDLFRLVGVWEDRLGKAETISPADARKASAWFTIERRRDGSFTFARDVDKIDHAARNNGFFTLLTTTDYDAETTLAIYRRRDVIEKSFDEIKNHIDMKRLRTHGDATTDGKLFCAFLALIITAHIQSVLSPVMRERSWSKNRVIHELDKIRVVTTGQGTRLMNPISKTQRSILTAFGLTPDDVTDYVRAHDPYVSNS